MYEIKLTVDAPGLADAIHHLATAIENRPAPATTIKKTKKTEKDPTPPSVVMTAPTTAPVQASAIASGTAPTTSAPATTTAPPAQTVPSSNPATTFAPAAVELAPVQPAAPTPAPAPAQKALTLTDISNAGAKLVDRGLMPQLVALLGKYGVQTVLALDPSKYEAFAVDLRALGANI